MSATSALPAASAQPIVSQRPRLSVAHNTQRPSYIINIRPTPGIQTEAKPRKFGYAGAFPSPKGLRQRAMALTGASLDSLRVMLATPQPDGGQSTIAIRDIEAFNHHCLDVLHRKAHIIDAKGRNVLDFFAHREVASPSKAASSHGSAANVSNYSAARERGIEHIRQLQQDALDKIKAARARLEASQPPSHGDVRYTPIGQVANEPFAVPTFGEAAKPSSQPASPSYQQMRDQLSTAMSGFAPTGQMSPPTSSPTRSSTGPSRAQVGPFSQWRENVLALRAERQASGTLRGIGQASPAPAAAPVKSTDTPKATVTVEHVQNMLDKFLVDLNATLSSSDVKVSLGGEQFKVVREAPRAVFDELRPWRRSTMAAAFKDTESPSQMPGAFPVKAESGGVHAGFLCDGCDKPIRGVRHHCKSCADFDLCSECVGKSVQHGRHAAEHRTQPIAAPGACGPRRCGPRSGASAPKAVPVEPLAVHCATCDLCGDGIIGVRHRCLTCPDFDVDDKCLKHVSELHPLHAFVPISDVKVSSKLRAAPGDSVVHHLISCDSCGQSPIRGVRYKCTHESCPDYDLCAACEALPIPQHDRSHNLLKIRQSVRSAVHSGIAVARSMQPQGNGDRTVVVDVDFGPNVDMTGLPKSITVPIKLPAAAEKVKTEAVEVKREQRADGQPKKTDDLASVIGGGLAALMHDIVGAKDAIKGERDSLLKQVQAILAPNMLSPSTTAYDKVAEEMNEQAPPLATDKAPTSTSTPSVASEKASTSGYNVSYLQTEPAVAAITADKGKQPERNDAEVVEPGKLGAVFVSDVTIEDGAVMAPATTFDKRWQILNSGTVAWPEGSTLVQTGGWKTDSKKPLRIRVPAAEPGEQVEIVLGDVQAPAEAGNWMSFWTLVTPDGQRFGSRIWIEVQVVADQIADKGKEDAAASNASSSSLTSSSIRVPTAPEVVPAAISAQVSERLSEQASSPAISEASRTSYIPAEDDGFVVLTDDEDGKTDWSEDE